MKHFFCAPIIALVAFILLAMPLPVAANGPEPPLWGSETPTEIDLFRASAIDLLLGPEHEMEAFDGGQLDWERYSVEVVPDPMTGDVVSSRDHPLLAHAGTLSPKDDCHKWNAVGERHWHRVNTAAERGGPCITGPDGRVFHLSGNGLCGEERIQLVLAQESFWPSLDDFRQVAEALKDCIRNLEIEEIASG